MKRISVVRLLVLFLALTLLAGCGSSSDTIAPLRAENLNLIFVVSPDLAYQAPGDVDPGTANLTNQGLQRSLLMATYLKQQVLGAKNVTAISVLEPMTHLQTANQYPDMAGIGYIQQFALLNQYTIQGTTAYSYPIGASYGPGSVPSGVVAPVSSTAGCRGLDFGDAAGNNVALATRIIEANVPGFYVFSAPWETISALLANIKSVKGYHVDIPESYEDPDFVYTLSITPSGVANLATYDANLNPPSTYPVLPAPVVPGSCTEQTPFSIERTEGVDGVVVPANSNTNETVYLIRHAEAHPSSTYEDGNYVGTGQWRALALPDALRGKISPNMVYSIDPAQAFSLGSVDVSYVRPSLTVLPYAIANNLPYYLVAGFYIGAATDTNVARLTSDFLFTGGKFSNQTILLAWEHEHFPPLITALLQSYGGSVQAPSLPWPQGDYDTIWTVTLDGHGNVRVDNTLCEGIDSAALPPEAPQF